MTFMTAFGAREWKIEEGCCFVVHSCMCRFMSVQVEACIASTSHMVSWEEGINFPFGLTDRIALPWGRELGFVRSGVLERGRQCIGGQACRCIRWFDGCI